MATTKNRRRLKSTQGGRKITTTELAEKARKAIERRPTTWLDTHPLREQIIECVKQGVSPSGLARALQEEGYPDVTRGKIEHLRQRFAREG